MKALHLNLDTIGNMWVNSNSLNTIWAIETISFQPGSIGKIW